MSFDALAWAGRCQPGSAPRKLVLLALADRHNPESNISYPSLAWLSEWTGLNRKTIISSLDALEGQKLISDSGQRVGKTRQVKAYSLSLETAPKTEPSQKRNSSTFSRKESQKRDTEPVREPVSIKAKASIDRRKPVERPPEIAEGLWKDWQRHRKAIFTQTALEGFEREASKAGWSLEAAITEAIERGWQGFKADWVNKDNRNGRNTIANNEMGATERAVLRAVQDYEGMAGCRQVRPANGLPPIRGSDRPEPRPYRAIGNE